jgi:dTDP-4-amino-4,6-dideoxygalactose transaminase
LADTVLSLPMGPHLAKEQTRFVAAEVFDASKTL